MMSWLNAKTFKCILCTAEFKYENYDNHMRKQCEIAAFKPDCQLCGQNAFSGEDSIIMHWREECPRMKVACLRCNIEFHRNDPHDCVEALLEARKADKSLIKDLQE